MLYIYVEIVNINMHMISSCHFLYTVLSFTELLLSSASLTKDFTIQSSVVWNRSTFVQTMTLEMWHDTMTRTQTHASALQNQSWQWKMTHFVYIFESFLMFFKVEFVAELPVISCNKHVFQIPRGSIVLTWFWHYGASQIDCAQRPLGQGTVCDDLVRWVQQGGP